MAIVAEAGKKETSSDCFVRLEITKEAGRSIEVKSKVASMYGESIRNTVTKLMDFFMIDNAKIYIEDGASLPFVLKARIEAVVKKCFPEKKEEFLSEIIPKNLYEVSKDTSRRSRLYVPGDQPRLIINAGLYKPDGVILDLEDSVAPSEKESARFVVRNALREVDFFGVERMVRINQVPMGLDDLEYIVSHGVHTILIPKCENPRQVREVDEKIKEIQSSTQNIFLIPIIESALGVVNAYEIATASPNVVALTIGLEDFSADICTERTKEGRESFLARERIVLAARASGIQPLDSVFSDITDEQGLKESVLEAKSLGFEGKGAIHPSQIRIINGCFAPNEKEIEISKKIVAAFTHAQKKGTGVVALGTKMIDPPVVKRAQRILRLAIQNGQLPDDWYRENEIEF